MCSHGHKLQFGDVQQAFGTGDLIKRETTLRQNATPMGSQVNLVMFGCSCSRQLMDWLMARGNGGTVSLLQPEDWVLRRRVFWR